MECKYNVTHAADALGIHRSSMLSRLERIQEVSGFDWDDRDERLLPALTFALVGRIHKVRLGEEVAFTSNRQDLQANVCLQVFLVVSQEMVIEERVSRIAPGAMRVDRGEVLFYINASLLALIMMLLICVNCSRVRAHSSRPMPEFL